MLAVMIRLKDDAARLDLAALIGPSLENDVDFGYGFISQLLEKNSGFDSHGKSSQASLVAEDVHLVLLSSRFTARWPTGGVSGPLFAARSLNTVPFVSMSNTHLAPT